MFAPLRCRGFRPRPGTQSLAADSHASSSVAWIELQSVSLETSLASPEDVNRASEPHLNLYTFPLILPSSSPFAQNFSHLVIRFPVSLLESTVCAKKRLAPGLPSILHLRPVLVSMDLMVGAGLSKVLELLRVVEIRCAADLRQK